MVLRQRLGLSHTMHHRQLLQPHRTLCSLSVLKTPRVAMCTLLLSHGCITSADVTARFDHVFWCGDLNFRLMNERSTVVSLLKDHHEDKQSTYESLLKFDQLRSAMLDGQAFFGFQEGKIKFGPTYKFEVGSSQFDGVKLRVPSYTDRILYRSKRKGHIECILYDSIPLMQTSDHRPVYGLYETVVRPGRDNIRLSAGLFNRDIYLEAVRRRAAALEIRQSLKASQVCAVM